MAEKRIWKPEDDAPVCLALLSGRSAPWPAGLGDWHARRRASELRTNLTLQGAWREYEQVSYVVERVLRALDRKYVGHEVRERFASNVADWLFGIPQPPAPGVQTMRDVIPGECMQAIVAGAWFFDRRRAEGTLSMPRLSDPGLFDGAA